MGREAAGMGPRIPNERLSGARHAGETGSPVQSHHGRGPLLRRACSPRRTKNLRAVVGDCPRYPGQGEIPMRSGKPCPLIAADRFGAGGGGGDPASYSTRVKEQ